jgi:UDP-N-acetylglucosamine--N-acetylmuramyl-(pentapeptide) pyrophosphoryl-undecaprenol N-acetylglucosamine transferase
MCIIMTGGGTGGHLAIIRAVKEHIQTKKLVYVGSTKGQDQTWFQSDPDFIATYFLQTRGIVNQKGMGKIVSLFMLLKAIFQAMRILHKHKAKVVFSVGGFSAAPMAIASKLLFKKLIIHEQNAVLGRLNSILKPLSHTFISSYEPHSPVTAYPIKEIYFDNARVRNTVKSILFLGGSQGAKAINTLALQLAPKLKEMEVSIVHQAGEKHIEEVKKKYEALGIGATLFGFTKALPEIVKEADFAVARAGASTLWELSASGIPTLYIPYPYAAANHQYHNALFLAKQNLAWVLREDELQEESLVELLQKNHTTMSQKLLKSVERDGAERIAQLLITLT